MKGKRVTVRLSDEHISTLDELRRRLKTNNISECVKFCINFTNVVLSYTPYSDGMAKSVEEAVKRTFKICQTKT